MAEAATSWPTSELRKELDQYQPGRQLDALVAEKILGRPVEWRAGFGWDGTEPMERGRLVRPYSTEMGAAWEIVEKLVVEDGVEFRGPVFKPDWQYLTSEGYPLGSTCWIVNLEAFGMRFFVTAPTPALAVCRAAIKLMKEREADACRTSRKKPAR